MRSILSLIILICLEKFSESYHVVVDDPNSYHYEKEQDEQGNYQFETSIYDENSQSNKKRISHQETGTLQKSNSGEEFISVRGEYYYTDNGYTYKVTYEADENGFRARVERIPDTSTPTQLPPTKPPIFHDPGIGAPDPINTHAIMTLQGGG